MKRRKFILLIYCCICSLVECVTLDGELFMDDLHLFGRMANFNKKSHSKIQGTLVAAPEDNPLLCQDVFSEEFHSNIALVPRGTCSFQQKALVAMKSGAIGMIVYNTLESRYDWNETSVLYPKDKRDYECANGEVHIATNKLDLDPPRYSTASHDDFMTLTSSNNVCKFQDLRLCESQRCLVTGKDDEQFRACCAWDLHVSMGSDSNINQDDFNKDDFVSMFCTMRQGAILLGRVQEEATIQTRSYSQFNVSSILLWLLAIAVVSFSAFYSIRDYRQAFRILKHCMENVHVSVLQRGNASLSPLPSIQHDDVTVVDSEASSHGDSEEEENHQGAEDQVVHVEEEQTSQEFLLVPPSRNTEIKPEQTGETPEAFVDDDESNVDDEEQPLEEPPQQQLIVPSTASPSQAPETSPPINPVPPTSSRPVATTQNNSTIRSSEVLELTVWHAVGFIVVATSVLLILFYFQFYGVVAVLYAIGCSGAVAHLVFYPLYNAVTFLRGPFLCMTRFQFSFTWAIFFALVSAYTLAGVWLYVGFTADHPSTNNVFFWVTQNLMASCACIVFLSVIRLSSIKVATALLMAAFIYDIFFVFITPYLFNGESVMLTVATSGGSANGNDSDENFCEKYPDDGDCQGGTILPLVFTIPRINDYRGGSTLLGLGDLILPGLLIAFSARLDQSKRLAVLVGMGESVSNPPTKFYHGYLFPLMIAYAIGLMMAYVAVRLMERGQPALLYIVPCCLGTMVVVGRHELSNLWVGPPELQWANNLVTYCERNATRLAASPATVVSSASAAEGGATGTLSSPLSRAAEEPLRRSSRSLA